MKAARLAPHSTMTSSGMHRIIERRKHKRLDLPPGSLLSFSPIAPVTEACDQDEGEGLVLDLSAGGCRVNSDTDILLQQPYSLIIQLPYYPDPVKVESAIARWTGSQTYGVMFIAMQQEQARYLQDFLDYLRSDAA